MSQTQTRAKSEQLLEVVTTISLPATFRFVAQDHFKVDTGRRAPVKIADLSHNFTADFLAGEAKTEEAANATNLTVHRLLKYSVDQPIIADLGDKTETTLVQFYKTLRLQRNGKRGALLTNGSATIFYIRGARRTLRTVSVIWDRGGWCIGISSTTCQFGWKHDIQVVSR